MRDFLEFTPTQMAYHLGVTEDSIRKWESGKRYPKYARLLKLHEFLAYAQKHGLILIPDDGSQVQEAAN